MYRLISYNSWFIWFLSISSLINHYQVDQVYRVKISWIIDLVITRFANRWLTRWSSLRVAVEISSPKSHSKSPDVLGVWLGSSAGLPVNLRMPITSRSSVEWTGNSWLALWRAMLYNPPAAEESTPISGGHSVDDEIRFDTANMFWGWLRVIGNDGFVGRRQSYRCGDARPTKIRWWRRMECFGSSCHWPLVCFGKRIGSGLHWPRSQHYVLCNTMKLIFFFFEFFLNFFWIFFMKFFFEIFFLSFLKFFLNFIFWNFFFFLFIFWNYYLWTGWWWLLKPL